MSNEFVDILQKGMNYTQTYLGQDTPTSDACSPAVDNTAEASAPAASSQASAQGVANAEMPLQFGAIPSTPKLSIGAMQVPPPLALGHLPPTLGQGSVLPPRATSRQIGYIFRAAAEQERRETEVLDAVERLRCQGITSFQPLQTNTINCTSTDLQIFPKAIVDAATYLYKLTGIPIPGIIFAILCALSMASWGHFKIKVRARWFEAQVDYGIIACPSGTRKSALCAALRKPFDDFAQVSPQYNSDVAAEFNCVAEEYNKRLRKRMIASLPLQAPCPKILAQLHGVAKESASWKQIADNAFKVKRVFVSASSQLALIKAMSQNGGCLAILEEEGHMLCSDSVLGKNNPVALLKGYTMETIQYDSLKQGTLVVSKAALPQLHIVQNDVLARLHSKRHLHKLGVLPRFQTFIVHDAERTYPTVDDDQGEKALNALQDNILKILAQFHTNDVTRSIEELHLSDEARSIAEKFEAQTGSRADQTTLNDDLKAYLNKLHGQAVRFAADIHLFNFPERPSETLITKEEMLAGVSMAQVLLRHAEVIYRPDGLLGHEYAKLILEWVRGWGKKASRFRIHLDGYWYCFKATDVQQGIRELKSDVRKVWAALDVLEASGYIAQVQTAKNARLCILNPRLWQ